jgi:hypothetical protein
MPVLIKPSLSTLSDQKFVLKKSTDAWPQGRESGEPQQGRQPSGAVVVRPVNDTRTQSSAGSRSAAPVGVFTGNGTRQTVRTIPVEQNGVRSTTDRVTSARVVGGVSNGSDVNRESRSNVSSSTSSSSKDTKKPANSSVSASSQPDTRRAIEKPVRQRLLESKSSILASRLDQDQAPVSCSTSSSSVNTQQTKEQTPAPSGVQPAQVKGQVKVRQQQQPDVVFHGGRPYVVDAALGKTRNQLLDQIKQFKRNSADEDGPADDSKARAKEVSPERAEPRKQEVSSERVEQRKPVGTKNSERQITTMTTTSKTTLSAISKEDKPRTNGKLSSLVLYRWVGGGLLPW